MKTKIASTNYDCRIVSVLDLELSYATPKLIRSQRSILDAFLYRRRITNGLTACRLAIIHFQNRNQSALRFNQLLSDVSSRIASERAAQSLRTPLCSESLFNEVSCKSRNPDASNVFRVSIHCINSSINPTTPPIIAPR